MTELQQQKMDAMQAQAKRDRDVIRDGITPAALEVLKRRFAFDQPVFQFSDNFGRPYTDEECVRRASIRDGSREVICYINFCLSSSHE